MKRKTLAIVLALVLAVSCLAGCGNNNPTTTDAPTNTSAPTNTPTEKPKDPTPTTAPTATPTDAPVGEKIPDAKYHWAFDGTDTDLVSVIRVDKTAEDQADADFGGNYSIAESAEYVKKNERYSTAPLYADGPVGKCLYLDGNFGIKLSSFKGVSDDSYTISFWLNADRLSTYGPVIQLGHNMSQNTTVSWINFTQSEWGEGSAKIFPVIWNRNVDDNSAWPWFYANDNSIHGKKEWVLVTLVANGQKYTYGEGDTAYDLINATLYLNGEQVFDSEMSAYGGMATEIIDVKFENDLYIGINWWDSLYKGFIDELYIFDEGLTAGQVKALYAEGNASVKSQAVEAADLGPSEVVATPTPAVKESVNFSFTVDGSHIAIDGTTVGAEDNSTGFWKEFSGIYPVAAGETVSKVLKVSQGANNWSNFAVILQNVPTGHSAADTAGYREYAVLRPDNFGWGDGYATSTRTCSWVEGIPADDTAANDAAWATFRENINGADVTVSVTNNTATIDVKIEFTGSKDGKTYTMVYAGISTAAPAAD